MWRHPLLAPTGPRETTLALVGHPDPVDKEDREAAAADPVHPSLVVVRIAVIAISCYIHLIRFTVMNLFKFPPLKNVPVCAFPILI